MTIDAVNRPLHAGRRGWIQSATVALSILGLLGAVAAPAGAGPTDPSHRYERIGQGLVDSVAILPMPGVGRALIAQRDGQLRLVTGDGLRDEPLTQIPVATDCGEQGLLGIAWEPVGFGTSLFVTYIAEDNGAFTVGHLERAADSDDWTLNPIWSTDFDAGCERLGGAIGIGPDWKLYVGTGDNERSGNSGSFTSPFGKILRMNRDGSLPAAPDQPNPIFPTSYVFGQGVRDPARMARNPQTEVLWFVDRGGSLEDELNFVAPAANYGWNAMEVMGAREIGNDPHFVFEPGAGALGIAVYNEAYTNLPAQRGQVLVGTTGGRLHALDAVADPEDPTSTVETTLYTPDFGEGFRDIAVFEDGYVYVIDMNGDLYRFRNSNGTPHEPSRFESIVPMTLRSTGDGNVEVAIERVAGVEEYGFYVGDLTTLSSGGYNHPDVAEAYRGAAEADGDAYARFVVSPSELGDSLSYVMLSAQNGRLETGVGVDFDDLDRPGGGRQFTCEEGCDVAGWGTTPGVCGETFVASGVEGPNPIGPVDFVEETDCIVVMLALSMEWCPPCRAAAAEAEELFQRYKDEGHGFTIIDVLHQDNARNPAYPEVAERWRDDFGLTHPVLWEDDYSIWNQYQDGSGSIPQFLILDKDGLIVYHTRGYSAGIAQEMEEIIEREVHR